MFLFRYFDTDFIREALKSRLSLGMTSNKTYHFQTTANHHRFIKVWTSIADLPTSKFVVQTFFLEKVWLRNTLPTYDLDICPNFRSFFLDLSPNLYCQGLSLTFSTSLKSSWFSMYKSTSSFNSYGNALYDTTPSPTNRKIFLASSVFSLTHFLNAASFCWIICV